jgi:multiple sugar transport system ATP-binding protein
MNLFEGVIEKSEDSYSFRGPINLSLGKRFKLENGISKASLGIRPEDISVVADNQPETISGKIVLVEPIGSDTYLSVDIAQESSLKVRVPASFAIQEGGLIRLQIEADDVHLFDAEGLRIADME